jgi:hypothetical protein
MESSGNHSRWLSLSVLDWPALRDRDAALLTVDWLLFKLRAHLDLAATFVFETLKGVGWSFSRQQTLTSGDIVSIWTRMASYAQTVF